MSFYHGRTPTRRFRLVLSSFIQTEGLAFSNVLSEEQIEQVFDQEGASFAEDEQDIFTPALTLWAFLSQVLFKQEQRSCLAAVSRVIVLLAALKREPCAMNSGPYCRARAKLSTPAIARLAMDVARGCERQVSKAWLWHRRHVKLVDGTTVSMPDTPENQEAFPQSAEQKQGLGFPVVRLLVLMSLATGMACGVEAGPCVGKGTSELALLRKLIGQLDKGDIVLADRYFCSYFMIAMLQMCGVDIVSRLHHKRRLDHQVGKRLSKGDHLIQWKRPAKPKWMDQVTYEQMPKSITVRQLEVHVEQPGFRVESFIVVTTLTDARAYTKEDIAQLYYKRWLVELDIRAIKSTLGMDVLRCKTPSMVRKEIWACLLAYNLIRKTLLESAARSGLSPRQLSFTAAMQAIAASWMTLLIHDQAAMIIEIQLESLITQLVGNRPNRIEPRAVKRRPKPHRWLTMTRDEARALLCNSIDPYRRQR